MSFEPKSINDINDNFLKDLKEKYSVKNNTADAVERIVELEEAEELAQHGKKLSAENPQSESFAKAPSAKADQGDSHNKIRSYIENRPSADAKPNVQKKEQPPVIKKPIDKEQSAPVKKQAVKEQSAPVKKPVNNAAPINKPASKPLNNRRTVDFSFLDNAVSAKSEEIKSVKQPQPKRVPKAPEKPIEPEQSVDNTDIAKAFEFLQKISRDPNFSTAAKPKTDAKPKAAAPKPMPRATAPKADEITIDRVPASKSYVGEEMKKSSVKEHAEDLVNRLSDSFDLFKTKIASIKESADKELKHIHKTSEKAPRKEEPQSEEKEFDAAKYNEDFLAFSHAAYAKERRLKKFFITGCVSLVSGLLILLVLFTMSRFIPAKEIVKQNKTSEEVVAFDDEGEELKKNEVRVECSFVESHSFIAFINTYYLHWTIVASLILMGASVICFSIYVRERGAGTISSYIISKIKEKTKK